MRTIASLGIFCFFAIACFAAVPARAEPKPWIWSWWESHWDNLDFEPYLDDAKHPHNSQWKDDKWRPEDWVAQRESQSELIRGFYTADILRSQYIDDDVPVLEVGPAFYMLGGQDKRRVAETIDAAYQVTSSRVNGIFMLYDWKTHKAVGVYTQNGLQLQ